MTQNLPKETSSVSNPDNAAPPQRQEIGDQLSPQNPRGHAKRHRINQYEAYVLDKENLLEANLGSLSAGLMRMGVHLEEALEQTLNQSPLTADRLQKLLPLLDMQLRTARQVERYAQLERQLGQTPKLKLLQRFSSEPANPSLESEKQAS